MFKHPRATYNEKMQEAITKQLDYYDQKQQEGDELLAEEYGLTTEELSEIGTEGLLKDWPIPEFPETE